MAEIAVEGAGAPAKRVGLRTVVAASAAGTAFEWYDFFVFGSLTGVIQKTFFSGLPETAGIAAASGYPETARPVFLLSAIRTMKFLQAVRPGEEIELRAEKIGATETLFQFKVEARVNGAVVAEGQLVLSVTTGFASEPK